MKYFSANKFDLNSVIGMITDYCMNIEIGKHIFENQEIIVKTLDDYKKAPSVLRYSLKGVHTIIRAPYGYIYLPEDLMNQFIRMFEKAMILKTKQFSDHFGFNHLSSYRSVEIYAESFVTLKVEKNITAKTKHAARYITKEPDLNKEGFDNFIWVFNTIEQLIHEISDIPVESSDMLKQLISIIYDPNNIINLQNGEMLINNLYPKYFRICNNLISLSHYGGDDNYVKNLADQSNISFSIRDIKNQNLAAWVDVGIRPYFCEKRKTAFEIIRQLGNYDIFDSRWFIKFIDCECIDTNKGPIIDTCSICSTPFYNEVYYVHNKPGEAYCYVCIHTPMNQGRQSNDGEALFLNSTVSRAQIQTKLEDIVNKIKCDEIYADYLIQGFGEHLIDEYEESKVIYFNFFNKDKYRGKNIICFSGSLTNFMLYGLFHRHQTILDFMSIDEAINYIQTCTIVPIQLLQETESS